MTILITLISISSLIILLNYFKGIWKHILNNLLGYFITVLFLLGLLAGLIDLL